VRPTAVSIPADFMAHAADDPGVVRWRARLPKLIDSVLADWVLTVNGSVLTGTNAVVLPVVTAAGESAALKVGWPHSEAEQEHLALRAWDGHGAIRLLRADPRRFALLLERADHRRDLNAQPVRQACETAAGLYRLLHLPATAQFVSLSLLTADWARRLRLLHDHPLVPRRLVDRAASLASTFADDPTTDGVLLHTDLHFDNVLGATRAPWLAIDPKPVSGDPCFEVAPLLWNRWEEVMASSNARAAILDRMYTVIDAAELVEDRVRDWVVVRQMVNVLWELESSAVPDQDWLTKSIVVAKAVQR
jgi:streptomycin 6-kinase